MDSSILEDSLSRRLMNSCPADPTSKSCQQPKADEWWKAMRKLLYC